jgi:hypothetical protein
MKYFKVADKEVSDDWVKQSWVCPHVYGGIPVSVVEKEYLMRRGGKGGREFLGIEGLC